MATLFPCSDHSIFHEVALMAMEDDLLETLLSYECPYTGAKRVAGLGTVEPDNGKCHGCSCRVHTFQFSNIQ